MHSIQGESMIMKKVCLLGASIASLLVAPAIANTIQQPMYQYEAARADASLRQRADAPMARSAFLRSDGSRITSYNELTSAPMKALPKEMIYIRG